MYTDPGPIANDRSDALVLFAHGARDERWAIALHRLADRLSVLDPGLRIAVAYLEFQTPDLSAALADLHAAGARDISLVPVFWSLGGHVARDLPTMLDAARRDLPSLRVNVLPVLSDLPGVETSLASSIFHLHRRSTPLPLESVGTDFAVGPLLKEIGRGKKGSRSLPRADARDLMSAMLAGRVNPTAVGGVLLALRMKGEQAEEIAGFLDAVEASVLRAPAREPGWVVLPSYNGARNLPNLVPLLALLLVRSGVPVLLHGQHTEPAHIAKPRVTTRAILDMLGIPVCPSIARAGQWFDEGRPAFVDLPGFAPELAQLLALRAIMGLRNVGHTLAKLITPVVGKSLLIASYTHPEFGIMQDELFALNRSLAMSMRGTEGESVISVRRTQAIDLWRDGVKHTVIGERSVDPDGAELPSTDAEATAAWTRDVLVGARTVPAGIQEQVDAIRAALLP
jgi:anthranilate phosphoribosyltransferase